MWIHLWTILFPFRLSLLSYAKLNEKILCLLDSLNIEEDESERADDATANETGNEEAADTEEKEEEDIPDVDDEETEKKEKHTEL